MRKPSSVSMSSICVMKRESAAIIRARPPVAITCGCSPKLRKNPLQNPVHQADVAVIKPALQMGHGVGADHLRGPLDVHAAQPRRARKQRIGAQAKARRNGAAQVLALRRDHFELGGRAKIHHDARPAIALVGGDAIGQPVRAKFGRVVDQHRHPRLDARLHKHRLQMKVCLAHLAQRGLHRRHHRRDNDVRYLARRQPVHLEQIDKEHAVLVHGLRAVSGHAPVRRQVASVAALG